MPNAWRDDGTVERIHDALRDQVRTKAKNKSGQPRSASPSAGIVDSQSLRGADSVGQGTRGCTAGKKVNGRKRHIVVGTLGLLLLVMVSAASMQDRVGGFEVLRRAHRLFSSLRHGFAGGAYANKLVTKAKRYWQLTVEVVSRRAGQRGFSSC